MTQKITPERSNEIVSRLKQEQYELNNKLELLTKADEKFSIAVATILSLGNNAYQIFQSSKVETKREILHILLSNLKLQDRKISYTLRKPYDYIKSLNKKIPSKTEGIAIGERAGTRTQGPLIKSQMLYRLSYTLAFTNEANIHKTHVPVKSFFEKNFFIVKTPNPASFPSVARKPLPASQHLFQYKCPYLCVLKQNHAHKVLPKFSLFQREHVP